MKYKPGCVTRLLEIGFRGKEPDGNLVGWNNIHSTRFGFQSFLTQGGEQVKLDMKARWRCWQADQGGEVLNKA